MTISLTGKLLQAVDRRAAQHVQEQGVDLDRARQNIVESLVIVALVDQGDWWLLDA